MKTSANSLFTLLICVSFPALVWAQGHQQATNADYVNGIRLYEEGFFEQSIRQLEHFLADNNNAALREAASYFLARSRAASDSVRTGTYFEIFIEEFPASERSADLLIELGHRYRKSSDYVLAIDYFERALEIPMDDSKGAQLMFWTAEMYISIGDLSTARAYYLRLSDTYRRSELSPDALYARGRLYLEEQDFASTTEAFELLRERHAFHPTTRRIGTALGESYFQQGMYREAITALRSALPTLNDDEQESKAILLVAESYNFLNELDDAATWYLRFVNRNEGTDNERLAHYGLGWVYHKQGIYHWAARSFGRAVTGDDDLSRKALYYKAVNEKLSGRFDLALGSFQEFGRRFQEGFWIEEAYYEWAVLTFEIGDYVGALEILLDLIRSGTRLENPGQVYTLLGEAYFANNEFARSIEAFEAAEMLTDIDPAIKRQAQFQRGWVLYQNQAYRVAQPIFEAVHADDPAGRLGGEALFWSADAFFNMQEYEKAIAQFRQFLRDFPNHEFAGAAQYSLGWSHFRMNQFDQAIEPFRLFLEYYEAPPIALFPYDIDTQLRLGDSYFAMRQYREAIRYYEKAIGVNPGADYALYQVANSYYRLEQTFEAVQAFRRLLRQFPDSRLREQAMYNIGYIFFLNGNYTQAIEEFQRLIRQYRGSNWAARAQYNIGDAFFNAGEFERAIEAYQAVLDNYPRSPLIIEAINGIQFSMLAAGMDDTSSELLEDFIRQNPQAATADRLRFRQAEFLLRTADYQGAIAAFEDYIRVTNSTRLLPEAHFNLAEAFRSLGDQRRAEQAYETILRDHPRSGRAESALLNLGMMNFDRGEFAAALDFFTQLESRTQRLGSEAGVGRGNALLALNRLDEAEQVYRRVLQRSGSQQDAARLGLGKVLLRKGEHSEAEPIFREISEANSFEIGAEAMYWLGFVQQQAGNLTEALQTYGRVRVLFEAYDNWVAMSLVRTAEIQRAQGNTNEARATYQSVLERYPETEAANIARRVLQGN
ncbi:MAG: tetratricopeptide repeat protein [Balneolales bacterium]|nr:tetratricopeptide repeat protein [Balneolales bacterium]